MRIRGLATQNVKLWASAAAACRHIWLFRAGATHIAAAYARNQSRRSGRDAQ